jgi:RHS repeat-associated protein
MDDPSTAAVTEGFGLMFYNARWYDPYLNHFTQPDSIVPDPYNPQDWNRYLYARNNPLRYTDPSGHIACDDQDENDNCINYEQNLFRKISKNYSNWERRILRKLYNQGGENAMHGVEYIVSNDIHIKVGNLPFDLDKNRGAWFSESTNTITLNGDSYSPNKMPDAWGLSLIIHEAKHIEQGTELSHSKLGEMEGWQVQFDVLSHFQPLTSEQQRVSNAQTLDEYVDAIQDHWPGYWFNGTWGLYTYPDYPDWIWYNGSWYYGIPWWLRINLP